MNWLRRVMQGRYGVDQLSNAMILLAFILMIINLFLDFVIINIVITAVLALCYIRIFSRNIPKRYQENVKFLSWWRPIKIKIIRFINRIKQYKNYRFYKCSKCGQQLRVPKGKGKIKITCPKCKNVIIKRT